MVASIYSVISYSFLLHISALFSQSQKDLNHKGNYMLVYTHYANSWTALVGRGIFIVEVLR